MRDTYIQSLRWLAFAMLSALMVSSTVAAHSTAAPEPVYWSQQLFLIPYKWDNTSTASQATAVKLYLSQDQGRSWNEIADAKPEVQAFHYHAPGDGEYWFSIRTFDSGGNAWPAGPHQPELRVIVDTQNPTITALNAQLTADGTVSVNWQATDANLNTSGASLQYRTPRSSPWQDAPIATLETPVPNFVQGSARWQVPTGTTSVWVRLAVRDLAGNVRDAGTEARVGAAPGAQLAASANRIPPLPQLEVAPESNAGTAPGSLASVPNQVRRLPLFNASTTLPPVERWPSDGESQVPLGNPGTEQYVAHANPPLSNSAASGANRLRRLPPVASTTPQEQYPPQHQEPLRSPFQLPQLASDSPSMRTASARPFGLEAPALGTPSGPASNAAPQGWNATLAPTRPTTQSSIQHLNSLQFEIGYDVDTAGTMGVTRVELWGTENDGQSWRRLAVDNDNRSPILASVTKPGDYGLAIVVATAGGIDPVRPRPGDQPEMLVRIDTTPPLAKLTGIQQGTGQFADHLSVRWQPSESPQSGETVSLSYSTSPTGPWITGATNLPHTGHYSWRLARHLPARFYLRLEARDPAGNTATDQTQVPVEITLPTPSGRLGTARGL